MVSPSSLDKQIEKYSMCAARYDLIFITITVLMHAYMCSLKLCTCINMHTAVTLTWFQPHAHAYDFQSGEIPV